MDRPNNRRAIYRSSAIARWGRCERVVVVGGKYVRVCAAWGLAYTSGGNKPRCSNSGGGGGLCLEEGSYDV